MTSQMVPQICRICWVPFDKHPKCEACGILIGSGHLEPRLYPHMDHMICGECNREGPFIRKTLARNWHEFVFGVPMSRIEEASARLGK